MFNYIPRLSIEYLLYRIMIDWTAMFFSLYEFQIQNHHAWVW